MRPRSIDLSHARYFLCDALCCLQYCALICLLGCASKEAIDDGKRDSDSGMDASMQGDAATGRDGASGHGGNGGNGGSSGGNGGSGGTSGTGGAAGDSGMDDDGGDDDAAEPEPDGWADKATRCGTASLDYPAGTWLVVGGGGVHATVPDGRTTVTTDGETWIDDTTAPLGSIAGGHSRSMIRGVGYGFGVFVAVGGSDNSFLSVSCDGVTWRKDLQGTNIVDATAAPNNRWLSGVAYKDGVFVAAGRDGGRLASVDGGVTWTWVGGTASGHFRKIAAGNGLFVAVGQDYNNDNAITSFSSDGMSWSAVATSTNPLDDGLAFGNGVFVAIGNKGAADPARCSVSTDGETWNDCNHGASGQNQRVFFVNGAFYLVADGGVVTSTDGEDWSTFSGDIPYALAYADGRYIGSRPLTDATRRGYSSDLETWTNDDIAGTSINELVAGQVR